MFVLPVQDPQLAQASYLIGCPKTHDAVVIDPQRDVDRYDDVAERHGLRIVAAAETHLHADFLSGLREFASRGVRVYASDEGAPDVRYDWLVGSNLDHQLLRHGDTFDVGTLTVEARHTPGHSPEHVVFVVSSGPEPIGVATGDFLFVEGLGAPRLVDASMGRQAPPSASVDAYSRALDQFEDLLGDVQTWALHHAGTRCGYAPSPRVTSTLADERSANPVLRATRDDLATALWLPYPTPPAYFARARQQNQAGPPLIGTMPRPRRLYAHEVTALTHTNGVVFIDTRSSRLEFMAQHLPGSLFVPLDAAFSDVAGAYVSPDVPMYLVAYPEQLDDAVRALLRLGLDQVAGYVMPSIMNTLPLAHQRTTPTITLQDAATLCTDTGVVPVDVRDSAEFAEGHLPNAVNLPHVRLSEEASLLQKDATLVVYSNTGRRAAYAAAYLERRGFRVAYVHDTYPPAAR